MLPGNIQKRGLIILLLAVACFSPERLSAQASIRSGGRRPFVVGVLPVVGNGVVGGVLIDSKGIVSLADQDRIGQLRAVREKAAKKISGDLTQPSKLRKLSLRGVREGHCRLHQ